MNGRVVAGALLIAGLLGLIALGLSSGDESQNIVDSSGNVVETTEEIVVHAPELEERPSRDLPAPPAHEPLPAAAPPVDPEPSSVDELAPEDDIVQRFRDTYGDPDPEHERQMIEARRVHSLEVVEGLMAGLAEQEEQARRRGDAAQAAKLGASLRRLEWRHRVLDSAPVTGEASDQAELRSE